MSPIAPLRPGRQSRLRLAYVLAVLLPVLGTVLTQHMAFLHGIPNSTNLLAVVIVGILGGLAPSLAAIAVAVGYESEPAFNRAFKRHLGEPPATWRRRLG